MTKPSEQAVTETDEWKLGCFFDWRPKPKAIACPGCAGKGEVGGGFKDLDGPRPCTDCWGSGLKNVQRQLSRRRSHLSCESTCGGRGGTSLIRPTRFTSSRFPDKIIQSSHSD